MGQVAVTLKIMPENPDVNIEKIKSEVKSIVEKYATLQTIKEVPVAFGLTALQILFTMSDSEGGTDKIENDLYNIGGVSSVESEGATLI